MTAKEIAERTNIKLDEVELILDDLEVEYNHEEKGIHITQEGEIWKMSIKPGVTVEVKDILPPELPSSLTKTLAVIAAKKPIKQSTVVKVRGNKAYDHIKKLQKLGFIVATHKGNTLLLDVTQKFFDYFRVSESDFRQKMTVENEVVNKLDTMDNEPETEEENDDSAEENKVDSPEDGQAKNL
jgi:segregation and condensation protein B